MQDPRSADSLTQRAATASTGRPIVLILNAYGEFLRRPVIEALDRAGFVALPAKDMDDALATARTKPLGGMVVGLNLQQGPDGVVIESGLSLFARFVTLLGNPAFAERPIMVTATYQSSRIVVQTESKRHRIKNPILLAAKEDVLSPAFGARIREHFSSWAVKDPTDPSRRRS